MQNKRLRLIILFLVLSLIMAVLSFISLIKLKTSRKEKKELAEVLEDAVETIKSSKGSKDILLKPKEREVLGLIANGYTNTEIADALGLSPETIKWYKKKFFVIFDVANSAELVKVAKEEGLL